MIRQFAEISSWRQHNITIEPHEVFTLNFRDTLPNIFVVNNPNLATLKVGISSIPRPDAYEFRIEYNTTETFGRPIGSNNIYILNDSSVPVKIVVFSIEKEFDPTLLKNMNVALEGYTIESSSEITGIKEGLQLPVKLINHNNVENMIELLTNSYPDIISKLQALIDKEMRLDGDGITLNGVQTDLTTVHSNLGVIIAGIGSLVKPSDLNGITTGVNIVSETIDDILSNTTKLLRYYTPEGKATYLNNATSFEYTSTLNERVHFGWLFNDGSDLNITVNGETVFSVLAGEQLADIEIELAPTDIIRFSSENLKCRVKYWVY